MANLRHRIIQNNPITISNLVRKRQQYIHEDSVIFLSRSSLEFSSDVEVLPEPFFFMHLILCHFLIIFVGLRIECHHFARGIKILLKSSYSLWLTIEKARFIITKP